MNCWGKTIPVQLFPRFMHTVFAVCFFCLLILVRLPLSISIAWKKLAWANCPVPVEQPLSLWVNRRLRARLQYLQSVSNGDTAVLHWANEIYHVHPPCLEPFYYYGLTSIPAWLSNHMPNKTWKESIYPFTNYNGSTSTALSLKFGIG